MRILMVFPYFSMDIIFNSYINFLAKRGHEIIVVGRQSGEENYSDCEQNICNIKFIFIKSINFKIPKIIDNYPIHLSINTIINYVKPDIIHINNLSFFTTYQYVRIASKNKIPCVVHVHGLGYKNLFINFMQLTYLNTLGKYIWRNANKIICLTNENSLEIQKYGCDSRKIVIIPNGVDINKFKPLNCELKYELFWGGRFVPEKGLIYLIKSLSILKTNGVDIKLVMAGDGPLLSEMIKIVKKLEIKDNVIFLGRLSQEKLPLIYNSAMLYVLPSLHEGMPFSLLEAMSCGKPIIGTKISGIREVVIPNQNGFLVEPKDSKGLANAIQKLLENKNLQKVFSENSRKLIVNKYDWSRIVIIIEKLYQEISNK